MPFFFLLGGLYKGTQAPQGAAGSAYDTMSAAKIKILADGNKIFKVLHEYYECLTIISTNCTELVKQSVIKYIIKLALFKS
mgnify:CR=1 FL=1